MTTAAAISNHADPARLSRTASLSSETSPGSRSEESALIERARRDPDSFGLLYRRHYPAIAGYLLRRTGDTHLAEDLAAEVFLNAWRGLSGYRDRGVPFRAWLYRIATNAANRWARRHRRGILVARLAARREGDHTADPATASPETRVAHSALLRIHPNHQAVLVLHHVEGLSIDEVARALGTRPGTVKSRLARARAALGALLEAPGETP